MNKFNIKKPTETEQATIEGLRAKMREKFRDVPSQGIEVEYLDKKFLIFKDVFWPHEDSKALVKNYLVHPGDTVLDVGTGSGVIAIFSAYKGAAKVIALEVNPAAVENAKANVSLHGFSNIIEVRHSDMLEALKKDEVFDIITSNPPFSDKPSKDFVEASMYDSDFKLHKALFEGARKHLKQGGRMYIAQSNFGEIDIMLEMAEKAGFEVKLIGENVIPNDFRIFYAFELKKK